MSKEKKKVKKSLVGYCYGCDTTHFTGEQYLENGRMYCKHRGSPIDPFHPPIPVEVPQEDIDEALASLKKTKEPREKDDPPTREEQIIEHLEMIANIFEIDIEQHDITWKNIVEQFLEIANVNKENVTHIGVLRKTK